MLQRMVVPLDGSPESEAALDAAVSLALASDGSLDLLLVRQAPSAIELPFPVPVSNRAMDELYLKDQQVRAREAGLTRTAIVLRDGDPAEEIVKAAREGGCELIVMTSRFRTGLSRVWHGSVADSVVRHSHLPVLLVRANRDAAATVETEHAPVMPAPVRYRRMLLLLDGSAAAASMIPTARAFAACNRAELILMRVVERPVLWSDTVATAGSVAAGGLPVPDASATVAANTMRQLMSDASDELDKSASQLRKEGCAHVSWFVEQGDSVSETILAFVASHDIDLIAMSTNGRNASRVVIGSVADAVLRETTVPVLLRTTERKLAGLPHVPAECLECQLPGLSD